MAGNKEKKEIALRSKVLTHSLKFEKGISIALGMLLKIDYNNSTILGNSGKALSFNDKVQIFLDTNLIDNKTGTYLKHFMSIRNQFMHNFNADSFENCLINLNGIDNYLLREFKPDLEWEKEKQLHYCYDGLHLELNNVIAKLIVKL